jgi:outer membrane protein
MTKTKLIILAALLISDSLFAQKDNSYTLTLQQAIEFAYQHQKNVLNAEIDAQIADKKVDEIIGMGVPQLSASFDIKDFEKIPTTTFPDFITPSVYNVLFNENVIPRRDLGPVQQFPIQFGTKWNATAGLNASQLIFQPSYIVGVQASKTYRELSQKSLTRTKIETAVAVTKAYYAVLVSRERAKLLDANIARVEKLKNDTKAMYDNGFVEKIDYDRVALTYNNLNTEKENVHRLTLLSEYMLKFQVGMPVSSDVTLTDSLTDAQIKTITLSSEKPDVSKRIEYSLLESQKRFSTLDLKRYRVQYLPTLVAYGSVSANALRTEFDIFDTDKKWYPTALIGATLSWNLFDGLQRERKIDQAKLELKKIENQMDDVNNALTLEAESNRTMLQNALASLNTQSANLELANEVVRVTKLKYDEGVGSNLEVITAETALREAQTNYYNAVYDALVAKVDLDKALGNIK